MSQEGPPEGAGWRKTPRRSPDRVKRRGRNEGCFAGGCEALKPRGSGKRKRGTAQSHGPTPLPHLSGVLLAVGLATALLTGLGLVLRPSSLAPACPARAQGPHVPAEHVPLGDRWVPSRPGSGPVSPVVCVSCTEAGASLQPSIH